jgi:hypothetical protein
MNELPRARRNHAAEHGFDPGRVEANVSDARRASLLVEARALAQERRVVASTCQDLPADLEEAQRVRAAEMIEARNRLPQHSRDDFRELFAVNTAPHLIAEECGRSLPLET